MAFTVCGKSLYVDLRAAATGVGIHGRTWAKLASPSIASDDHDAVRVTNLDTGAADVGEIAVGDVLTVTLFDDVVLTLTLKEQMQSPLGGDTFLA